MTFGGDLPRSQFSGDMSRQTPQQLLKVVAAYLVADLSVLICGSCGEITLDADRCRQLRVALSYHPYYLSATAGQYLKYQAAFPQASP
jgi:hypothetical protein